MVRCLLLLAMKLPMFHMHWYMLQYEPALTSFVVPVPPTDHVTVPLQPVAVKVAFSVPHTFDLSLVKVGGVGVAP